ncbi:uncharacterized protein G2W53_014432 [Senna tora]|uniref:Uncharacterized protein n=1 Tax=Senna tora TaxID=362788 RepID=A0A834WTQ9_9FABA|nr:uncharacterized protein G2W53_014432 [Senna tora]
MTSHTFQAFTSPIGPSTPFRFSNTSRSDRHQFTQLPYDHESHSTIKSTRLPKYNAKRSV